MSRLGIEPVTPVPRSVHFTLVLGKGVAQSELEQAEEFNDLMVSLRIGSIITNTARSVWIGQPI